ncbi:facilitated trehalose transporter Tret1-like [Belonocnema kinseyi]|uniref:facilitated trehalose transporter Tret1-like n=1 Tax=Belonocnema kinseyi TaxID=2817044 RepID=UPI00143D1CF8|nr:facilitated trehalose transporter Tret1-like [Belonocnema kinseyi]
MAVYGSYSAWTSPAIPHLTSVNSTFPVTDAQGGWIVSLLMLGDLIGGLIIPLFIDRIGRKYTLLLFTLPGLIGWILIIFAKNYLYLYLARFIAGIGEGGIYTTLVIYLTEISEKNIRGALVNMINLSLSVSIFIFSSIAAHTSYMTLNLASASLPIIFIIMFPLLLETPYYYLMKGRNNEALQSLMKLRGINEPEKLETDISEMKLAIDEDRKLSKSGFMELISKSYNRKGLLIVFFMKLTQFLSGIVAISAYAQEIFSESSPSLNPKFQVMILTGFPILATLVTNIVIDRFNRRTLFLTTGLLAAVCLGSIGSFFFMQLYLKADVSSIKLLPLVSLVVFYAVYMLGFGTIPYIVQGELFPISVKGNAVTIGMIVGAFFAFGTSAGYSAVSNAVGTYTTFWSFASAVLFGSVVTYWITPETKGMTLEEIQAIQNPEIKKKLELERNKKRAA